MSNYLNSGILTLFQSGSSANSSIYNINYSEYANIRSGAYRKLLNSYYNPSDKAENKQTVNKLANNSSLNLTNVKRSADSLKDSAEKLVSTDAKSVFAGNDRDAVVNAIKSFVSDYNDVIDAVDATQSSSVLRNGLNMAKQTNAYSKSLAKVGVTIGSDSKLSVDETLLKSADLSDIKSLFNGVNSFAGQIYAKASQIGQAAQQSSGSSLYGSNGSYNNYNFASAFTSYV